MNYLNSLNPVQKEAVLHTEGPLLIFAGAGSGKTRVLTYRVAHLIEKGIDPYHIIAITFTNKAAREMQERIANITPVGDQVWVSTFHAACTRILRREIDKLGYEGGFSIYDTQDSLKMVKECIKELNLSDTHYPPKYVMNIISSQKNELISPLLYEKGVAGQFRETNIAEIYALYQQRLRAANALDFDDIIFQTVELLRNNDDIRKKYTNRFRYVMVDEYQDTNHAQYELVNLLSGYANNLCVVGDDDQSIYGWRGANIENILRFEKDYAGTKVIKLEENYRSTQTILDAANAVIGNNEARAEKKLWTKNGEGEKIRIYMASNERDEGAFVAKVIKDGTKENKKYKDFAILYRANAQSRNVEDALVAANIPYRIFGGVRFYEHTEIKDVLAYLKIINNPADDIALLRIINVPRRGIGAATIGKVQQYAFENRLTLLGALKKSADIPGLGKKSGALIEFAEFIETLSNYSIENAVASLLKKTIKDTAYMDWVSDGTQEGEDRISNLMELIATASGFETHSEDTSLGKFLEDVALVADIDNYEETANAVTLMTLHSAKGLEFNSVIIVGCEENLFPSAMSIENGNPAQLEEERRLCYVGFTRARQTLYITHAMSRIRYDKIMRNAPSRFLQEVPMSYMAPVNTQGKPREFKRSIASQPPRQEHTPFRPTPPPRPTPKEKPIDFTIGDKVKMAKYGVGEVMVIDPAGADYEVTIDFETVGRKKFMAHLLRITKV